MLAVGIFRHFSSSDCLMVFSEDRLKCGRLVVQLTFKHSVRLWKVGRNAWLFVGFSTNVFRLVHAAGKICRTEAVASSILHGKRF